MRVVLENIGPIKKADISAGDLTVLVGPQATGKSIFLQLFKFCVDHANIVKELKKLGFDWKNELESFLQVYFGEGMQAIWNSQSYIELNGRKFQIETHVKKSGGKDSKAKVFYIPLNEF
ncbi:ATP-binding protein [Mesotoga sp. Brook.08.YT.4.2.5.1]|uniref:ATP-binding protein n=1 Tax=Mesotoga sp. Brook.08.YT.4.2.5.1 TaxID=1421001 RepID=UPI000C9A9341|nr:ATP-binding protein [Mesotoga sp. Brook.08.YT.4.2.5.1]